MEIAQRPGDGAVVGLSVINTILSGSTGAIGAVAIRRLFHRKKQWSLIIALNGGLTGMVRDVKAHYYCQLNCQETIIASELFLRFLDIDNAMSKNQCKVICTFIL